MAAATELVDWVRLADHTLHPSEALRLVSTMEGLHPASVKFLVESFHPDQDLLWQLLLNPIVTSE
jgi:nucleolar pre-ribosomal-associated protein 1